MKKNKKKGEGVSFRKEKQKKPRLSFTSQRVFQYVAIILILGLFGGAYWYFKAQASRLNAPQNDIDNNGLIGMWSFNGVDMTATTATDRSGQGNNGTLNGEVAEVGGKVGQALHFDGSNNDFIDIDDPGASSVFDFASTDPISVSTWVYPTAWAGGFGSLWTKGPTDSGSQDGIFGLQHNSGCTTTCGLTFFYRAGGSFHEYGTSSAPFSLNTWQHITFTYTFGTGSSAKIYVNGKLQPGSWISGNGNASVVDTNDSIWLGANQFDEDYIGRIDEFRIYNRILSTTEVDSLYAFGGGTHVNSSVSQNQGSGRLESSVALYWAFDATSGTTATDTSTNGFTGTLTNMEDPGDWVTGQIGNALDFDGSNEYVTVADDDTSLDVVDARHFTLTGWFNRDTFAADHTVIAKRNGIANTDDGYIVYIDDTTDKLTFEASDAADTDEYQLESVSTFTATGWHHFAISWNDTSSTETKLYIDGVAENATATGTFGNMGSMANAVAFRAGAESDAGNPFDGKLDELRLYNRSLLADEVAQLYRITTPTGVDTGLKLYYAFNPGEVGALLDGGSVWDLSGAGNQGIIETSGGPELRLASGKVGQAIDFWDGDTQIEIADPGTSDFDFTNGSSISLSYWVYSTTSSFSESDSGGRGAVIEKGPTTTGVDGADSGSWGTQIGFSCTTTCRPNFYYIDGSEVVHEYRPNVDSLTLGKWHHISVTYTFGTASTMKMYVDGKLQSGSWTDGNGEGDIGTTNNEYVFLARSFYAEDYLGKLDEIRVYNRTLSVSEVDSLYAFGSGTHINSSVSQPQGTGRLDSGVAGYWALDSTSGTSATDSSTNGLNGTLTNMEDPGDWTTGQIGGALDFDGSNEYVSIADNTSLDFVDATDFTLTGWFNRDTFAADHTLVAKRNSLTNTDAGYIAYIDDADDKLYFEVSDAADEYQLASASAFTATGWNHFAIVFDDDSASGTEIYINGAEDGATDTGTIGNIGSLANAVVLALGAESDVGNPFDGKLDENRLYNRALSPDEIAQLYRLNTPTGLEAGLNLYLSFNGQDTTPTTVLDRSGVGHIGTLGGSTAKTGGKIGQAVTFDGIGDVITIPDHPSLDFNYNEDFSISFWAKFPVNQADTSDVDNAVFEKWSNNGTGAPYYVDIWNQGGDAGRLAFKRYDLTNASQVNSVSTVNDDKWHHIVTMKSGATMYIYIDGVQDNTGTDITTATTTNADNLCIANRCAPSNAIDFQGSIDEFRIYSRALTVGEITALYNMGR